MNNERPETFDVADNVNRIMAKGGGGINSPFFNLFGGRKMFVGLLCMLLSITLGFFGDPAIFTSAFVQGIFYAGIGLITGGNVVEHLLAASTAKQVTQEVTQVAREHHSRYYDSPAARVPMGVPQPTIQSTIPNEYESMMNIDREIIYSHELVPEELDESSSFLQGLDDLDVYVETPEPIVRDKM